MFKVSKVYVGGWEKNIKINIGKHKIQSASALSTIRNIIFAKQVY